MWKRPMSSAHITKVMCYGAFQCLLERKGIGGYTDSAAHERDFPNVRRVLLGNLPDLDRRGDYFGGRTSARSLGQAPGSEAP